MPQSTSNNKINIYPMQVSVESDVGLQKGQACKINPQGMIMEVFLSKFTLQQPLKLKWVLPVDNISMEEDAFVMKLYSQPRGDKIQYLMEVHFKKIKPQNVEAIKSLLERIEKH